MAYGEWEFNVKCYSAADIWIMFVASAAATEISAAQNGYAVRLTLAGSAHLYRITAGGHVQLNATVTGTFSNWVKIKVTRTIAGEFTLYINDTLAVAAAGTNPITDTTYTTSEYISISVGLNDRIGLNQYGASASDEAPLTSYTPL